MSLSVKIKRATFENFIGFYNGLGKKKLVLDFSKILDKDIILILGDNGTGKSTLSSILHPLPGTTDKRNRFIREGKEGLKIIEYIRSDDVEYECKIVYSPSKTGHNSKGYIKRTRGTQSVELNPNGNISSYKEILFEELGVSDAILKLANQNDVCKGHVDMTSTERKINMSSFLPEDIFSGYFAIVDKIYRDMKTRVNVLVEAIGKMNDKDVLEVELKRVTEEINKLVEKRDKTIGKIKEFETRINIIEEDQNLEKLKKDLYKELKSFDRELEDIRESMRDIYQHHLSDILDLDDSSKKITKLIEEFKKQINNDQTNIAILKSTLNNLKSQRNDISGYIEDKKSVLADISTDYSLNELKSLYSKYKERYNELDKLLSKLNTSLSKDDLMVGYSIVESIRRSIENINANDVSIVESVVKNYHNFNQYELNDLYDKKESLEKDIYLVDTDLRELWKNSNLKDVLEKRPDKCTIDDCPFIADAQKWRSIKNKIDKYTEKYESLQNKWNEVNADIQEKTEYNVVYNLITNGFNYIKSNMPIIRKLPYNEKYSDIDSYLKCILKTDRLNECDDFDSFIEILEYKDEYQELKYTKIPSIESDIKLMESQGKVIGDAKSSLEKLTKDYEETCNRITETKDHIGNLEEQAQFKSDLIDYIDKFYKSKIDYDEIYESMVESHNKLEVVSKSIEEADGYRDKLKEKKIKLKEIENELNPLTRKRELYKTEQLKILDHEKELASLNEDMYECEIVRDSLSIKGDGMPVDALEFFMESVRQNANALLANTFDGSLYLEEFEINSKDFIIPYKKNGDRGMDVSFASSSERSFISLCLTLAIIEEVISTYGILILDEIDRGFSDHNKYKFIDILGTQIRRVGISQTFMTTHNREYYDGYNLGYILFPGHSLNKYDEDDVVKVYKD